MVFTPQKMILLIVIITIILLSSGGFAQENEPVRDYSAGSYSYTLAFVNRMNNESQQSVALIEMMIDITVGARGNYN